MINIFKQLKRSGNKTQEMIKLSKAYVDCNGDFRIFEKYIRDYYDFISKDELLGQYIKMFNLTSNEMVDYYHLLLANGFIEHKGYLIPTYVFSFSEPLKYFLSEIRKGTPISIIGFAIIRMM